MKVDIDWTIKQQKALWLLSQKQQRYTLLYGGGGSGKSFVLCYAMIMRALTIPNSVHGVFRETGVSLRNSLFNDTFRQVLAKLDDGALLKPDNKDLKINQTVMEYEFSNGSKIVFSGLEAANMERLYGMEYSTIWINEVSQIHSFSPIISTLIFRLRQNRNDLSGIPASRCFWFDCNPPKKRHFIYKRFIKKLDDNSNPITNPDDWKALKMNTVDAVDIIGQEYIDQMSANLSLAEQRRMIHGEFLDDNDDSLFPFETIDAWRKVLPTDEEEAEKEMKRFLSTLTRVVISVDPATTANKNSDATGIVVCAMNEIGHAYVLEDATMKGRPEQWARKVSELYEKWNATLVVAEKNQGGDMVETTLRSAGLSNMPVKLIHARVGKLPRAEPVSALYEKGLVHHFGIHRELEDQMESFTHDYNPSKQGSPDRLDALVHGITELLISRKKAPLELSQITATGIWS